jgi:DNA-directed RNA polymerase subunit E'/Rpb7
MSINISIPPLVNPYSVQVFETRVALHPHQMDNQIHNNIKDNLFENLRKKVENKCNMFGYVKQVYEIAHFGDGILERENLHGIAVFNVQYRANICIPVIDTCIILKIDHINDKIIKASNSDVELTQSMESKESIKCIITNINTNNFENQENGNKFIHKKNNNVLKKNDYIKVNIKGIKFNALDEFILILGHLEDIATNEEVGEFYPIFNI